MKFLIIFNNIYFLSSNNISENVLIMSADHWLKILAEKGASLF